MKDLAWGSCQYQTLAELFEMAKKHGFETSLEKLEAEGLTIDYEYIERNELMILALADDKLGEMFDAWRAAAKDLWFALSMAEDLLLKYGLSIEMDGDELENDHPIRQALVAALAWETGCITDEAHFKHFDT